MKKNIMRTAWEIRKAAAEKFGCKVSEILMSACLRQAWEESKMKPKKGNFEEYSYCLWEKDGMKRIYFDQNPGKKIGNKFYFDCNKKDGGIKMSSTSHQMNEFYQRVIEFCSIGF